ncbi:hypothetical protein D3C87_1964620 [compost metagenome]
MLPRAGPAERARAAIAPYAYDDVGIRRIHAGYALAACAHDGVQGFHAVDAVPEEIGVGFFKNGWAIRIGPQHLFFVNTFNALNVAKRGSCKNGDIVFF